MTQYSVELSADAQYQINSIVRYIAMELGNLSAAKRFIDDVEKAMKNVQSNLFSHMIRPHSETFDGFPKRQFQFRENYIMFYVVFEDRLKVRILRIAYSRMDLSKERCA